ncbi:MAG: galactose-1-phosphate uridylyltransferase [Actinomycetota bacterium]|nr:galactose-1-phosphate uridylyltransferase [Actinomycetota bacterium]
MPPGVNQLRLDPLTGRWVVVRPSRAERPGAFARPNPVVQADTTRPCPFCPGNEDGTLPALESYGTSHTWKLRVIPNLYPAFEGSDPFVVRHVGPVFTEATAGGIHEVLILSPFHDLDWSMLDDDQCALIMAAIRDRIEEHAQVPGLRYTQVIVNAGREAGASLDHPHGQLLGLSFVPRELVDEQAGFARFAGGCVLCTTINAEEHAAHRVVYADDKVLVVCPYWSGVPYEMLVLPRYHGPHLHHTPPQDIAAVGRAIRQALARLHEVIDHVSYNLVFHTAPYRANDTFHWHVHLVPKLTSSAGFEMGTGMLINIVAPELAADDLRAALRTHS